MRSRRSTPTPPSGESLLTFSICMSKQFWCKLCSRTEQYMTNKEKVRCPTLSCRGMMVRL